jgi:hypothetical protein
MRITAWLALTIIVLAAASGRIVAQAGQDSAEPLYPVFGDGAWGLINASGELVLPLLFEQVGRWPGWIPGLPLGIKPPSGSDLGSGEPIRDLVIPVRLNGQAALATRDGRLLAMGRYESIGPVTEGRRWVRIGTQIGFADENGELVIPAQFDQFIYGWQRGYLFVQIGKRWGVIDRNGHTVIPPTWEHVETTSGEEWAAVLAGKRWGVIDRSGAVVIEPRFEVIFAPRPPLIFAVASGRAVYIRPDGSTAFELTCPRRRSRAPKGRGYPFSATATALVKCGDLYGLIDTLGTFIVEPQWEHISFSRADRIYTARSGQDTGILSEDGRWILEPSRTYAEILACDDGLARVFLPGRGAGSGLVDLHGRLVIPPSFQSIRCFREGLSAAHVDGKSGYIDRSGNWVIQPQFWRAHDFRGDLAVVETPITPDLLEVAYIDKSGNVIYRMELSGLTHPEVVKRFR